MREIVLLVELTYHHLQSATNYNSQEIGGVVPSFGARSLVGCDSADLANQPHC